MASADSGTSAKWDPLHAPANPQDGSGTWDLTTANWDSNGTDVPWSTLGTLTTAVFGTGTQAAGIVNLNSNLSIGGLVFNPAGSGNYQISSGVNDALMLSQSLTPINASSGVSPTILARFSGQGGIFLGGVGTVNLADSNSYTGQTYLSAGTVNISNPNVFGASPQLLVQPSATLNLNASPTLNATVYNNGTFNINAGQTLAQPSDNYFFNQSGGTLNIYGSLSTTQMCYSGGAINGQVLFNYSAYGALMLYDPTGTGKFLFTAQTQPTLFTSATGITSGETVTVAPTGFSSSLYVASGALLNSGTLSLISSPGYQVTLEPSGLFTNNGVFTIAASGGVQTGVNTITNIALNNATFNVNASTSTNYNFSNSGTMNIAVGQTFAMTNSNDNFNQAGGTLNIGGTLSVSSFNYSGGTINGQVLFNTSTGNPALTLGTGLTSSSTGNFLFTTSSSQATIAATVIPSGVTLSSQPSSGYGGFQFNNAVTNNGIVNLVASSSSDDSLYASNGFTNNGTLNFNGSNSASYNYLNSPLTNTGVVNVNTMLTTYGINNSGTFNIGAGQNVSTGSGYIFNQAGGTLNIGGTLSVSSFNYSGGTINGQVLFNTSTGNPALTLGTGLTSSSTGNFLFTTSSSQATIAATLIPSGVTLSSQPSSGYGGFQFNNAVTNNGVVNLVAYSNNDDSLYASSGFTNNGTLNFNGSNSASYNYLNSPLTNTGVVNVNTMLTTYGINNSGTFNIGAGQNVSTGSGYVFNQAGGTLNIGGTLSVSSFNYSGGTINGQVLFNTSTGNPALTLGTGLTSSSTGNFLFTTSSSQATIAATLIPSGVTLSSQPSSGYGGFQFNNAVTNNGVVNLVAYSNNDDSLYASSGFTNNGTLNFNGSNSASYNYLNSPLTNTGVVNVNTMLTTYGINNSGTFNIGAGQNVSTGSGYVFNQAGGTLNIGGTLSVSSFNYSGGTINGQVLFNTSTGNPALTLGTGLTSSSTGNFLFTLPSFEPTIQAATIPGSVTITSQPSSGYGGLQFYNAVTNNGTVNLVGAAGNSESLYCSSTFTNVGTLNFNASSSTSTDAINNPLTNIGVVNVNSMLITSVINNSGTFNIAVGQNVSTGSGAAFNQTAGILNDSGTLISNTFNLIGGNINVNGKLYSSTFTLSGGGFTGQVQLNTSSAILNLPGGGVGNFLFNNSTGLVNGNLSSGIMILMAPTTGNGQLYSYNTITSYGSISLVSANNATVSFAASLQNGGTFTIGATGTPSGLESITSPLNNYAAGTVNLNASTGSSNVISNSGNFVIASGAVLSFSSSIGGFNQANGTLAVPGSYYVGGNATASTGYGFLNVSGGSVNVLQTLKVWNGAAAVHLTGGSITTAILDTTNTPANFIWTGGTLSITGESSVVDTNTAVSPFGSSLGLASGMTLNAAAGNDEVVGLTSTGTLTQTGGINNLSARLNVGSNTGSNGSYLLSGTGIVNATGAENIGVSGTGSFTQSGGTNNATILAIGNQPLSMGTYTLSSGGSLFATTGEYIGQSGVGIFNQTGGTQTVSEIGLGTVPGGMGVANLTGGITVVPGGVGVGGTPTMPGGTGLFNVSGTARVSIGGALTVFDSVANGVNIGSGGSVSAYSVTLLGGASSVNGTLTVGTGGLLFANNDSPTITTAGTILLNGDVTFNAAGGTASIISTGSGTLDLGAVSRNFNVAQSSATVSMSIGANITDGALVKTGAGTLLLSGSNSFVGSVTVAAGTLSLGSANALNGATSTLINTGGTLDLNGQSIGSDPLTLNSSGVAQAGTLINDSAVAAGFAGPITIAGGASVAGFSPITLTGAVNGTGGLSKVGFNTVTLAGGGAFSGGITVSSGTLAITAPISFTGGINLAGGTLAVSADNELGDPSNGVTLSAGSTFEAQANFSSGRTVTAAGGTLQVDGTAAAPDTLTLTGPLGDSGSLPFYKTGLGTLRLTAPSSINGVITISAGTLSLSGPGGALPAVAGINVTTSGTLELNSSDALGGNQTSQDRINDAAPINLSGGTLSMVGSESASTTENLGQLILSAGASTIAVNSSVAGHPAAVTFSSLGTRAIGGTLSFNSLNPGTTGQVFLTGQADGTHLGGWATVNGTDFAKYNVSQGVVPFTSTDYSYDTFAGNPDVQLTPAWNSTNSIGNTTIATLNLNASSSTTPIVLNQTPGTTLTLTSGGLIKQGVGSATIAGGTLTSTSPVAGSTLSELDISVNGGPLYLNSALAGQFVLTERGSGTLILGGSSVNSYSGFTLVSGNLDLNSTGTPIHGDLIIDGGNVLSEASNQMGASTNVVLNSGSWNMNGNTEHITSLTNNNGTMLFNGGHLFLSSGVDLAGGTTTLHSTVYAPEITITAGNNEVEPTASMEVSDTLLFNSLSPALLVDADPTGAAPGQVILDSGATLTFAGTGTASIVSTTGTTGAPGSMNLGGTAMHTVKVGTSTASLAISTTIFGAGMDVTGAGMVDLMASNSYTGGTMISQTATLMASNVNALGANNSMVTFDGGKLALRSDSPAPVFPYSFNVSGPGVTTYIDIDQLTPVANTFAGTFTLNTMTFGSNTGFYLTGNDGGTLVIGGTSATGTGALIAYNATQPGAANFHTTANLTINGPLSNTSGGAPVDIYKDGSGTMTFEGTQSNSFGNATVAGGTMLLNKTSAIAIPGNLNIMAGATVKLMQSNQIATTSAVTISGATGASLLDLNGNSNTFGSTGTGTGGLVFQSGGTLSTGTGMATLNGYLNVSGGTPALVATIQGNLNLGTSTRTINVIPGTGTVDLQISAVVSGTSGAGITKTGAGTLLLNSPSGNTFTGPIQVLSGVLQVAAASDLGNKSNTIALDGGSLQFGTSFDPSPSGGISLPLVATASTLDTGSNTVPVAEPITGAGGLTKQGIGKLVLQGANTFSGGLLISLGEVQVSTDASLGFAGVAVNLSGGTLDVTSSFTTSRPFVIGAGGGTINASSSVLTLTTPVNFGGNLTVSFGAVSFNDASGSPTIVGSPVLTINPNATVYDGGATDPLSNGSAVVNVTNNSLVSGFDVLTGSKSVGSINGSGNTIVSLGSTLTASSIRQTTLTLNGNATIAAQTGTRNTSATVSVLHSLVLTGSLNAWITKLDLTNNDLIDQSDALATVNNQVHQGFALGSWTGTGGITSSSAANNTRHLTALGVIQNNQLGTALYGSAAPLGLFDGQSPNATDVLVKYTYYGDANLDGKVDASDYSRIDNGYLTHASGWFNGDFNYDGLINGSDYTLIDNAFNSQGVSLADQIAVPDAVVSDAVTGVSGVPEPSSIGLVGVGAGALLSRRRRAVRSRLSL